MKLSIELKLLAIFTAATTISVGGLFFAYDGIIDMKESADWVNHTFKVSTIYTIIRANLKDAERNQRNYVFTGDPQFLEPYRKTVGVIDRNLEILKKVTSDNPNEQERLITLKSAIDMKYSILDKGISTYQSAGEVRARKYISEQIVKPTTNKAFDLIKEGVDEENELLAKRIQHSQEIFNRTKIIIILVSLAGLLIIALKAIFIRKNIILPLEKLVVAAKQVAAGNLRLKPLDVTSRDELADLASAFNEMISSLILLASQNILISKDLSSASAEVLASVQQQAAATKEQAVAVQETTATMEEIGHSGNQISERAKKVTANAEASSGTRAAGIAAVQGTNQSMLGVQEQIETVAGTIVTLSERNQAIGEIIATVNEIAERSDLLALNAAIEAAAAGEQGRSFAIVANEIKSLAEQAKSSTVEIRSILGEIQKGINSSVMTTEEAVKRAEIGRHQSGLAEETINELTQTTQESIEAFQQILAATYQQQIGFSQITQALKSIQTGAQQTATSTNQLERAAYSMNTLGQQLQKSAEKYQI
jgi:methyl-accepting chemotaxis protein